MTVADIVLAAVLDKRFKGLLLMFSADRLTTDNYAATLLSSTQSESVSEAITTLLRHTLHLIAIFYY